MILSQASELLAKFDEEDHPRDARGRWAALAGAVGAGAAGYAANSFIRGKQRAALAAIRSIHSDTVRSENLQHATTTAILDSQGKRAERKLRAWPVPLERSVLRHDSRNDLRALQALPTEVVGWDAGEDVHAVVDSDAAAALRQAIDRRKLRLDSLETATPPGVRVTPATRTKAPGAHSRTIKAPKAALDAERAQFHARVAEDLERNHAEIEANRVAGHVTDDEAERMSYEAEVAAYKKKFRSKLPTKTVPVAAERAPATSKPSKKKARPSNYEITQRMMSGGQPKKAASAAPKDAQKEFDRAGSKARIQGKPDDKELARIRRDLRVRFSGKLNERRVAAQARHDVGLENARGWFRGAAKPFLARLPTRKLRIGGLLAAAAIGGAGAGLAAWHAQQDPLKKRRLAKAADDPDPADELLDHGVTAEEGMAERLARIFRAWTDRAAADLLKPAGSNLAETIHDGLQHATEPMLGALAGGASTPPDTEDAPEAAVTFTLAARNPRVTDYMGGYWQDKIVELRDEQMDTIKALLINAAKGGASPQEMAKQIKETIGLTSWQADQVLRYREQLETLDAGALGRNLRNHRHDGIIERSIASGTPLSQEQVDKFVDDYHRRYLAYRATTIARTEGVGAANNGHMAAVQDTLDQHPDLEVQKTWMAKLDERTRPDHYALHGQTVVGFDTPFQCDSGELIRWPHDQTGSAREVIKCRCTIVTKLVPRSGAYTEDSDE